ncbi:MAG: YkgJ family cysteine cluster protein [Gemmatimonadota bacterium]
MSTRLPSFYDCDRCPAYCCSYPRIELTPRDLRRLASHLGIDVETAERRFTKAGPDPGERVLRHRTDPVFGTACRLLDPEARHCTVYAVRPAGCRSYPGTARCGYYDLLASERRRQDDPDLVVTAWVTDV